MSDDFKSEFKRRLEADRAEIEDLAETDLTDDVWIQLVDRVQSHAEAARRQGVDDRFKGPMRRVLLDRFEVYQTLGQGGQAETFLAWDRRTEAPVVVKKLCFSKAQTWKSIELFEREAAGLKALSHHSIPTYVDAFHLDESSDTKGVEQVDRSFYLVQEFVEGEPLSELIKRRQPVSQSEAERMLGDVLEVLAYLHGLNPPVIHRDIKPSNLIRRPDGSMALIDFGAMQVAASDPDQAGSTIVGTSGYMPPEQLMGRAEPASDHYALGAAMVHLLSHRHPSEMPVKRMKLQFEPFISVSKPFASRLSQLLEPAVEDRSWSAAPATAIARAPQHTQVESDPPQSTTALSPAVHGRPWGPDRSWPGFPRSTALGVRGRTPEVTGRLVVRHRRNGNTEVEIHRAASHRFLIVPMVLVLFFVSRSIGFFFPTLIALVVLFSLLWRNTTNRLSLTADGWSLRGRLGEPLVSGRFEDVVELRRTQTGGELVLRTGRLPLAASGRPLTDRELVVLRRLFRLSGDTSGQRTADDRAQDDGQAATNFVVAVRSEDDLEAGTNAAAARPVDEEAPSTVTADRSESSREASTGVVAAEVDDIPV